MDRPTDAGTCADLAGTTTFTPWLAEMQAKDWQVYIQPPFRGAEQVVDYLARYVQHLATRGRYDIELCATTRPRWGRHS